MNQFEIIEDSVNNITSDVDFELDGIRCSICPFSSNEIHVSYGGKIKTYNSADEFFQDDFWNGLRIREAALQNRIEIL